MSKLVLPMRVFALPLVFALGGCPAVHQPPPARAQDAANELNLNARFGRMEMAAEGVSPKAREAFFERRRGWGGNIRIADYELAGLKMQGEEDAEIYVKIAWYRANEGDLRTSTLKQKWHEFKGDWKLVDESRLDGDVGLLGEPAPAFSAEPSAPKRTQFPTIRLGQNPDAFDPAPAPAPAPADAPR